jgi:hypothetical protein
MANMRSPPKPSLLKSRLHEFFFVATIICGNSKNIARCHLSDTLRMRLSGLPLNWFLGAWTLSAIVEPSRTALAPPNNHRAAVSRSLLLRFSVRGSLLKGCQLVLGQFVQLPICEVAIDLKRPEPADPILDSGLLQRHLGVRNLTSPCASIQKARAWHLT